MYIGIAGVSREKHITKGVSAWIKFTCVWGLEDGPTIKE